MKAPLLPPWSAVWLLSAMLAACSHESSSPRAPEGPASAPPPSAAAPASSGAPSVEMAPTPYTAEQIRVANRAGTVYRYKVETAGDPVRIMVMEFTAASSADTAEVRNQVLDETGKATGPAEIGHHRWDELRRHAEFPRAALTVEPGSIDVPAGKFEAMVYTLRAPNGETTRFYFAKSYAGPPVLFYTERAGVRVRTQTLLERKSGG